MKEMLEEFVDSRGVPIRVDRQQGVVRGVKILGLQSRNGRTYRPEALAAAVPLYEGARVNVNHPKGGPHAPRDYQDRIGQIRNVAAGRDGLFADLHFNPKHALAEQLIWDAEHAPENVGFSHNVEARTSRRGERVVVEAIVRVESVDLVADPATTRGLFESAGDGAGTGSDPHEAAGSAQPVALAEATLQTLKKERPDLVEMILQEQVAAVSRLEAELERLRAAEALEEKKRRVRQLLDEYELPDPDAAEGWAKALLSPRFLESLLAAADEQAMRRLVEDRAAIARAVVAGAAAGSPLGGRPCSRDPLALDGTCPPDAKAFVKAIT